MIINNSVSNILYRSFISYNFLDKNIIRCYRPRYNCKKIAPTVKANISVFNRKNRIGSKYYNNKTQINKNLTFINIVKPLIFKSNILNILFQKKSIKKTITFE